MRIPKARILKYAAMGIIAAFIATFFLKKEKQQGHPRDYAEIAAENPRCHRIQLHQLLC